MSHFTVLVIGDNPEQQLAPYHEFECTGYDDQYVQEIDKTLEYLKEHRTKTRTMVKGPDGTMQPWGSPQFYREPTEEERKKIGSLAGDGFAGKMSWSSRDWGDGLGFRTKIHEIPADHSQVEVPYKDLMTFAQFIEHWHGLRSVPHGDRPNLVQEHKYGYVQLDENGHVVRAVRRTNPNAKWDWYLLGGRWTGFFKLRPTAVDAAVGEPGLQTPAAEPGRADQARKGDIDFVGMRRDAAVKAGKDWDEVREIIAGREVKTFDEILSANGGDHDKARKAYWAQPVMRDLSEIRLFINLDDYLLSRKEYTARAAAKAIQTFAVVKDGQWYERGQMGMFAVVYDEKAPDAWDQQFASLLDGLPDDTLLSVYDCHI